MREIRVAGLKARRSELSDQALVERLVLYGWWQWMALVATPQRVEAQDAPLLTIAIVRGLPAGSALADANIAVMTNYTQIGDNARLEVTLVAEPPRSKAV